MGDVIVDASTGTRRFANQIALTNETANHFFRIRGVSDKDHEAFERSAIDAIKADLHRLPWSYGRSLGWISR